MDTPTEVDGGGNGDETDQTACASDSTQSDNTLINRDLNSGMFICVQYMNVDLHCIYIAINNQINMNMEIN